MNEADDQQAALSTNSGFAWNGLEDGQIPWVALKSAWQRSQTVSCLNCNHPTILVNFGLRQVGMFNRSPNFQRQHPDRYEHLFGLSQRRSTGFKSFPAIHGRVNDFHSHRWRTLDTYGHLLEGSQAADLTSILEILKATGTDSKLVQRMRPLGMHGGFLTAAKLRKTEGDLGKDEREPTQRKNRINPRENAVLCVGAKRRTRDSNPQPVSRRLISNQVPNHSAILQRKG